MSSSALHRAARKYAEAGIPVHPLKPRSKTPATAHGFHDATTDLEQIDRWWSATPDANIGGVCGQALVVLDIDGPEGVAQLEQIERDLGPLPATATATTGKGTHYYFKPNGVQIGRHTRILPGIDLLGHGGFVVLPPSVHPNGHKYEWTDHAERATVPGWLEAYAVDRPKPAPDPAPTTDKPGISEGQRNDHLARHAGRLRRLDYDAEVLAAALEAINQRDCLPPLPAAEVRSIAASVAKYEPGEAKREPFAWTRLDIREAVDGEIAPPDFTVEGLVARGEVATIAAPGGSLKSTIGLQVCIDGAVGRPALGAWTVPGPLRCLFVSEDMPGTVTRRKIKRLVHGSNLTDADLDVLAANLDVRTQVGIDLTDPDQADAWHATLSADLDLIVLDSRVALETGSMNDAKDRRSFYRKHIAPYVANGRTACIVLTHPPLPSKENPGSQRREAGSVDGRNQTDRTFYVDGFDETKDATEWTVRAVLRADKQREGASLPDQAVTCSGLSDEPLRVRCEGAVTETDGLVKQARCAAAILSKLRANPDGRRYQPEVFEELKADGFDRANDVQPAIRTLTAQGHIDEPAKIASTGKRGYWLVLRGVL